MDSDDSVDLEEVDRLVGGLDDLDNDLFGIDTSKKPNKLFQKNDKPKVVFPDFNDDNSIDDLLSDGVDTKKNYKSTFSDTKSNKIAELFKIDTQIDSTISKTNPALAGSSTNDTKILLNNEKSQSIANKSSPTEIQKNIPKISETLDLLKDDNSTGVKQTEGNKRSAFIEDIFGTKPRTTKNIAQTNKTTTVGRLDDNLTQSMPNFLNNNDAQTVKTSSTGFTLTNSATREPRRRAKSNILDDPLGLLGTTSKPTEEIVQQVQPKVDVKKSVNALPQDDLPEWLSGTKRTTNAEKLDDKINNKEAEVSNLTSTFDLEQQASIVALHQQEHELRTAKILTEQSNQLNSIVSTQKAKIEEQEKMLNTLVKSQVERQANLDTQIKMQQAKIDHFIQALSRQPSLPVIFKNENDGNDNIEDNIHHENKNIETESMINKLKIEKDNLENIISILKIKQETEIKILDDSHELQMHFMEITMKKLEDKLKNDTELLENNYEIKIEKLINEKKQLEDYYKLQIETLKTDHAEYVKEIYNRHLEQIKLLQNEHSNMMENICRSKELERQTVDFIENKKNDLDNVLKQSQLIFDNIQTFSDKLNNKDQQITDKQNNALKKEEEYLQEMKENLKNQQDSMEKERRQLIIAAEKIETQSLKLSSEYKKNSDIQDDIESRLKIREKALLREKELFLEQSKWEREHIQYMKETWTIEQKRQMQMIADEREKLHAEKAKFEVLNNLKCNSDDITKAELESALNTARQVAKEANAEREKWQERVASLDMEKKRIQIKEKSLTDKARELENLTQSAISKRDEGLKALKDAHYLEKQQTDKMNQMQIQLEMLAQRENKIATDKLSLARDRLIMKTSQREKPEKDMTSNYHYSKYENDKKHESQIQTHFSDIVDPKLILLKLNLDNNLSTSNQLLSDMQITN
ncbi:hypothetical protein HCN44_008240 [Aphidius gifuensis]|uniref:Fas-binding factor 1 C-terminal domain-containing protein n=1 Tax=Aphidius gifuensis TaxID=684658 RepID=A0A834XRM6_APHGI|nr:hypothetical protein HCN44_008240 [Aphidius gifuensis]